MGRVKHTTQQATQPKSYKMSRLYRSVVALAVLATVFSQKPVFDYSYPDFRTEQLAVPFTISAEWNRTNSMNEFDTPDGRWINPQVALMDFNNQVYPGYSLSTDKLNLTITMVTKADLGFWHCIMERRDINGTLIRSDALQKIGLNVKGPYFEDLWAKYQRNTTIGLGAGFGFAVFAVVLCMAWQFRWEKRQAKRRIADAGLEEDELEKKAVEMTKMTKLPEKRAEPEVAVSAIAVTPVEQLSKGQTNAAFEADPEPEVKTTSLSEPTPVKKPSPPPSYTEEESRDVIKPDTTTTVTTLPPITTTKVEELPQTSSAPDTNATAPTTTTSADTATPTTTTAPASNTNNTNNNASTSVQA